ncbi:MAG: O-antigen ligase family protein, partial [Parcubacteria group bacterium]
MESVKQKIVWLWKNAEKILIVVFFLTFSFNIRQIFLTPYSFLNGGFNEYTTMSFSWADLLMLATIFIYTIKLFFGQYISRTQDLSSQCNKRARRSNAFYFSSVSRETFYLLVFLGWTGLSIFWSQYQPIAAYRFFTLVEILLFAILAAKSLNEPKWLKTGFFAIVINGLFQSLLGIAQFIRNGSLELHFLGESVIGPNIDGVAKIVINSEKHVRAYGTFPHPNILAGFLLVPLFIIIGTLLLRKLSPLGKKRAGDDSNLLNTLNKTSHSASSSIGEEEQENVSYETFLGHIPGWLLLAALLITGLGFFLTFSRSSFLGFFVGLLIYFTGTAYTRVRKGSQMGIGSFSFIKIITFIIIASTIIFALFSCSSFFSTQSLQERNLYQNVSYETILNHPFAGVGIGQFVMSEYQKHPQLESWQYQPV